MSSRSHRPRRSAIPSGMGNGVWKKLRFVNEKEEMVDGDM
jgi:hypothetical protein